MSHKYFWFYMNDLTDRVTVCQFLRVVVNVNVDGVGDVVAVVWLLSTVMLSSVLASLLPLVLLLLLLVLDAVAVKAFAVCCC